MFSLQESNFSLIALDQNISDLFSIIISITRIVPGTQSVLTKYLLDKSLKLFFLLEYKKHNLIYNQIKITVILKIINFSILFEPYKICFYMSKMAKVKLHMGQSNINKQRKVG